MRVVVAVLSGRWQALLLTVGSAVGRRRWTYRTFYWKSRWWRWRRLAVLRRAKGRCEQCRRRAALDVHHRPGAYRRLGRERKRDLLALCRRCHNAQHARR